MESLNVRVNNLLLDCGCDPSKKGFECVREAIKICYEDYNKIHGIVRVVYREVYERTKAHSPSSVERSIRTLITGLFDNTSYEEVTNLFGNVVSIKHGTISNKTFIAACVLYLKNQDEKEG